MKLYLSSFRLGNNPQKLKELFGKNTRIAIIPNAKDNYEKDYKAQRLDEETYSLEQLGFTPEVVDLQEYFGDQQRLIDRLQDFAGVWVVGGNTFVLRVAMHESGFDTWLKSKLADKDFVYAGYSAGICILSPSLKGLDIVDNPKEVQEAYNKDILWDGLGLVEYSFAPHYQSDHPESAMIEKEVAYMKRNNIPYKALRDGEVLLLELE
jgi:dipeptidase E